MANHSKQSLFPLRFKQVKLTAPGVQGNLLHIDDLTLTPPGKLAIIGENGAGKSLLLRLAHGLITPQHGRVSWGLPDRAARARQAMVFQRPVMLRRSVLANLRFAQHAASKRAENSLPARDLDAVINRLGLAALARRPARLLSFGEQQKLAIGRAMLAKPEVLFMDEPTASLDPSGCAEIEALIEEIAADGTQIFIVTHQLEQARRLASQVLFLHQGKVAEYSDVETFFTKPSSETAKRFLSARLRW